MAQQRDRMFNTRKRNEGKEKPERPERPPRQQRLAFSDYAQKPDSDGLIHCHYAPCTYQCEVVRIFIDSTDGGRIQLRVTAPNVEGDEFVEREVHGGENIIQVSRAIPAGTRVRLRMVEGSAVGIWTAWTGMVSD